MTTTNPSLAVDNDAERREKAWRDARGAVDAMHAELNTQRAALESENARLRAALTGADRSTFEHQDGESGTERFLRRQVQILRSDYEESERARAILAKQLDEECARLPRLRQEQTARIAELEAEVAALKASRYGPPDPFDPAPAAPAVPVVEVGSRWRRVTAGYDVEVIGVDDKHVHWDSLVNGSKWTNERAWFLERFTRLPDEPSGGGEP